MRVASFCAALGWACLGFTLPCLAGELAPPPVGEILELTPLRVIELARLRSPRIAIGQADVAVAAGERRAAATPAHNPDAGVLVETWRDAPEPDLEAELVWTLEAPGLRAARTRAADAALRAAEAGLRDETRQGIEVALTAYFRALHARLALELIQAQLERDEALRDVIRARVEKGEDAALDSQVIEAEVLRDRATLARSDADAAVRLQRLLLELAVPPDTPVRLESVFPPFTVPAQPPSPAGVLAQRPDVLRLQQELEAAEAHVREERRAALPAPTFAGGYVREDGIHRANAGMSIPLPLLNRNQGGIQRAKAQARRARAALDAHVRALETDLLAAHREAVAALAAADALNQAEALRQDILLRVLEARRRGEGGLLEVLAVRRGALEAAREALDGRLEAALALIRFESASGGWR